MYLSKSKYCKLCQCPKILWLEKYKPDEAVEDASAQARFDTGNRVGDLAMGLFGEFTEVTAYKPDGTLDLDAMIAKTAELVASGAENICEASFSHNGLYCAVDILKKQDGGYAIYEVKSAAHVKHVYITDVAYQKYVLEKCGVNVTGTYVVNINSDYVRRGALELDKLFKITDVAQFVGEEYSDVEQNVAAAEALLSRADEPNIDIDVYCSSPYECAFFEYCKRAHGVPDPSVFDLYNLALAKKVAAYNNGLVSFDKLRNSELCKNKLRARQVDFALRELGTYIDKSDIRRFLDRLTYPLYFLDFETMQLAVPEYDGSKPYSQIPFQYSLHIIREKDGDAEHKEFLAEPETDPRRALAERLVSDIPQGVTTLAYNKNFECARINELAKLFPDLSERLCSIRDGMIDLIVPFHNGSYYNRAMGGSFSIKSVLPAIFPNDPELDYHNLDGVHNGSEAMDIFPRMKYMSLAEREKARKDLLEYCKLDTYAMVKILRELERVAE